MASKKKRDILEIGDTILDGRYEVIKIIHTSGMANVYLIVDKYLNKQWCLKQILKSQAGKNMVEYRSLVQEANIMKNLNHPNIPRIVTMEDDGDSLFIVMDYVDGISVKAWINKNKAIKQGMVVAWMKQVCKVMIYLHNMVNPVFYRDMKPDNIMIQSDGHVRVLDFGISEIVTGDNTHIKEPLGTRGYAAPEQRKGGLPFDLRSDIYAFGRTLFYMLTGLNPIAYPEELDSIRSINPSLSIGLDVIIQKCCKEDPFERYQNFEEVLYDLQNYEKLDVNYLSKVKRKIVISIGLFAISLMFIISSSIPLILNRARVDKKYTDELSKAESTLEEDRFISTIQIDPTRTDAYDKLIECYKLDGVFSEDEEDRFLDIITPNLSKMRWSKGFGKLAYDIGKLYWFYFEDENKDIRSANWFKEAINRFYKEDDLQVLYDISNFKKTINIDSKVSDKGIYKSYWNNLISAKSLSNEDIMSVQVRVYMAECILNYSYMLNRDGVSKDSLIKEVDNIRDFCSSYNSVSSKSDEVVSKLYSSYDNMVNVINQAYMEVGN